MQERCYDEHVLDLDHLTPDTLRLISRAEYERMVDLGMFADERVELLCGQLVRMNPQGAPHALVVERLTELLILALHGRARVRCQLPYAASSLSEPEPDLAVIPLDEPTTEHPSRAEFLVEVSDSSLAKDRRIKHAIYADAGVPESWIVDLEGERVEILSEPTEGQYQHSRVYGRGQAITPRAFPDVRVAVDDVLP
jgi:Uma2 family endonuclease